MAPNENNSEHTGKDFCMAKYWVIISLMIDFSYIYFFNLDVKNSKFRKQFKAIWVLWIQRQLIAKVDI